MFSYLNRLTGCLVTTAARKLKSISHLHTEAAFSCVPEMQLDSFFL